MFLTLKKHLQKSKTHNTRVLQDGFHKSKANNFVSPFLPTSFLVEPCENS